MGKGRKSLPDNIKLLQGTNQKCRTNKNAPEVPMVTKLPNSPKWLTERGKDLYKSMGKELMDIGLINNLNIPGYAIMVDSLARYVDLAFEIKEHGMYQRSITDIRIKINPITKGDDREIPETVAQFIADGLIEYMQVSLGSESLHPRMKAQKDAEESFRKWATEFGLTPSAQSRIIGNLVNPNQDPDDADFN